MNICPTCDKEFDPVKKNSSSPFCSERCRLIDLGEWLSEKHRIPHNDIHSYEAEEEDDKLKH